MVRVNLREVPMHRHQVIDGHLSTGLEVLREA
jgi:hypothetical protein